MAALTVWYRYASTQAHWKIRSIQDEHGAELGFPKESFPQLALLQAAAQQRHSDATLVLKLDHPCERNNHPLRGAQYLQASTDGTQVFVRCACKDTRSVALDAWEQAQRA